jgi:hypothetical protein
MKLSLSQTFVGVDFCGLTKNVSDVRQGSQRCDYGATAVDSSAVERRHDRGQRPMALTLAFVRYLVHYFEFETS